MSQAMDPAGAGVDLASGTAPRPDDALSTARLGFVGVGWIGRNRMERIGASGTASITAILDTSDEMAGYALAAAPEAVRAESFEDLLGQDLDGLVIATPSAMHASQAIAALERGIAVFCQKPLGRTAEEVRNVVAAARHADVLLSVDLSYRYVDAFRRVRDLVRSGELGDVFAVDLVFHNAYGPDKEWFYDPVRSGGGCVMDLGVHLVDQVMWALDFPDVLDVQARLFAHGMRMNPLAGVEDFAEVRITVAGDVTIRLACSWKLHAGVDAIIEAAFYGTDGGCKAANVGGSFYDFRADRFRGTGSEMLVEPPDDWGGRAAVNWAERLRLGERFDPCAEEFIRVAEVLDRIYER